MHRNKHIVLIGMPGTGKSTIADAFAKTYKSFTLVELDDYIETIHKATLPELIAKHGDSGFEIIEENAMLSIDLRENSQRLIVSTGGSVVYSEKGMAHLGSENTIIIYLDTPFPILAKRTDNFQNRGIVFNGKTPEELHIYRHKLYTKYADIILDTKGMSVQDIIIRLYELCVGKDTPP
jgi:shikimate kinase